MSLVSPARVGHAVTHSSNAFTLGGAAAGVAIGVVMVFVGWEVVAGASIWAIGSAILGAGATVSTTGTAGMLAGKYSGLNKLLDASVAGHLLTGFPTVKLGPEIKNAARADPDTTADCAGDHVGWEGADHVFLGNKPMSRVGDRLKCQGKIMEGEPTIYVGGNPSQEGKELDEAGSDTEYWVGITLDVMGLAGSKTWTAAVLSGVGLALDATENPFADHYTAGSMALDQATGLGEYGVRQTVAGALVYGSVLFH